MAKLQKWLGSWVKDSSTAAECENTCTAIKNSKAENVFSDALKKTNAND